MEETRGSASSSVGTTSSSSSSSTSATTFKVPKHSSSLPVGLANRAYAQRASPGLGQVKRGGQELAGPGGLEGTKRLKPEDKARVEHERVVAGKNKRIAELARSLGEREREVEELRGRVGRQERLVAEVEERVRCPVCLDVPTSSPVFACPRGHLVCSPCHQGLSATCPMCRTKMTKAVSLLAATVIEHLEHRCKFKGCEARLPLAAMAAHRAACEQRTVPCPATACRRVVAAAEVVEHILHTCTSSFATGSHAPHTVAEEAGGQAGRYVQRYTFEREFSFKVSTFLWRSRYFFLSIVKTAPAYANLYIQMLGTQEECERVTVSLSIRDPEEASPYTVSCSSHPYPLDMPVEERGTAGLMVGQSALDRVCKEKPGTNSKKFLVIIDFKEV